MKYKREGSLDFVEVDLSYLPADYERVKCPKLVVGNNISIANFRGYYWTDMSLIGSNEGLVHNNSEIAENPILIVKSILKGLDMHKVSFSEEEINTIKKWYEDTIHFHSL